MCSMSISEPCDVFVQAAFDLQLNSIKQCGNTSIHDSVQVHPITQRYAQLTSAMLILNADYQV